MKYLAYALCGVVALSSPALAATQKSVESHAVNAFLSHCFGPLSSGISPAQFASENKLPEVPQQQAEVIAKKGGRVFVVRPGSTLLATPSDEMCSIIISQLDFEAFKKQLEFWFDEESPFRLMSQKVSDDSVTREYEGMAGKQAFYMVVSFKKEYKTDQIQGMMTLGKLDTPTPIKRKDRSD